MSTLKLDTSLKAILTRTDTVPNPAMPGGTMLASYPCDLNGEFTATPIPIYRDLISGVTYAKVFEKIPKGSKQPEVSIHYVSADGSVVGYFVVAPDFNNREKQVPKVPAATVVPATNAGVQAPAPVRVNA